jgi:hypothetical protein
MTVVLASQPAKGTLSNFDPLSGSFQYTPNAGATGKDTFLFRVRDQYNWGRDDALATINIGMPPSAAEHDYTVAINSKLSVSAANGALSSPTTDVEGDPMTASLNTLPQNGVVFWSPAYNGSFTYTPNPGFHGFDSFQYIAHDQDGDSSPASIVIQVLGQVPVAHDDTYTATLNTPLSVKAANGVLANDTDAENDPLSAVQVSGPSHGTIYYMAPKPPPDPGDSSGGSGPSGGAVQAGMVRTPGLGPDGQFIYIPQNGYRGPDSFTYQAQDIDGLSNVATVHITVGGGQPWVARDDSYNVIPNVPLTVSAANGVLANDTDAENDPPTGLAVVTGPANGRVQLNLDGSFTYTPNAGYTGTDHFTYQVQDQDGPSNIATVSLVVQRRPPVAQNDYYEATLGNPLVVDAANGVKANDTDAENDPMTPVVQAGPRKGRLDFHADGSFTYTFTGVFPRYAKFVNDIFTYVERDQDGTSNVATVVIHVTLPGSDGGGSDLPDPGASTPEPVPANLAQVASLFTHSEESYRNFVTGAYQRYLGRLPDAPGLAGWVQAMQHGLTDEQLEAMFIGSAEYIANHGGPGAGWVQGMYQDLLGRTPAQAEVDGWVRALNNGASTTAVALGFAASAERESQRVAADYQTYLGRDPSAGEVAWWVNGFEHGLRNEDVAAGFLGSPEYFNDPDKGQGDRAGWVWAAYQEVFHRLPSDAEINSWLTVLK